MTLLRRHFVFRVIPWAGALASAGALGATLPAGRAEADAVGMPRIRRPSPRRARIRFHALSRVESSAPDADARAVEGEANRALLEQQRRIDRCVGSLNLRQPPNRRGPRELSGTLHFDRSPRPVVRIAGRRDVPGSVVECVREALSAISIRSTPRGTVTLAFRGFYR